MEFATEQPDTARPSDFLHSQIEFEQLYKRPSFYVQNSRSRWCGGYRACPRTRQWTMNLKGYKVRNTTSLGGKIKPSAHVVRFYSMSKIPAEYDRDTSSAKLTKIFRKISHCFVTNTAVFTRELYLINQKGLELRLRTHSRLENGRSAWDALHDTTP
jgi:hypothetical protein